MYVTGPDGQNRDLLVEALDGDSFWELAWSPDGTWLLFGNWKGGTGKCEMFVTSCIPPPSNRAANPPPGWWKLPRRPILPVGESEPIMMKIAVICVLTIICIFLPLLSIGLRQRTRLLLLAFFGAYVGLPFLVNTKTTLFFEHYALLKGITRGLDLYVADFLLISLVIDRILDTSNPVSWWPRGSGAFAILLVGMALSIPDAVDPNLGLFELIKFMKGMTLFWVMANIGKTREGFHLLVETVIAASAFVIGCIFLYWLRGDWYRQRVGFTPHKNLWALFLNLYAPITLGLCFFAFHRLYLRIAFLLGALGFGVLMKMSDSRGGQVCFALSLFLTMGLSMARQRRGYVNYIQILVLAICLMVGLIFSFDQIKARWKQGIVDSRSYISGQRELFTERRDMRAHSLEMFKEHPVNGVGFGNYCKYWFEKGYYRTLAHHLYLLTLAETGVIGIVALMAFLCYWLVSSFMTVIRCTSPPVLAVAVGLPAVFLSPMVHGLVEYNLRHYVCYMSYCAMAGLASSCRELSVQRAG